MSFHGYWNVLQSCERGGEQRYSTLQREKREHTHTHIHSYTHICTPNLHAHIVSPPRHTTDAKNISQTPNDMQPIFSVISTESQSDRAKHGGGFSKR